MDSFCPLGPWVVHKSVLDASDLSITCSINGVPKQSGRTSELIFDIPDVIERVTQSITLLPGDIILTGTPSGNRHFNNPFLNSYFLIFNLGVGMHRSPPEFLKPGDIIESEIEGIGKIVNKVVADE